MSTVIKRFTVATERIDKLASGTQLNLLSYSWPTGEVSGSYGLRRWHGQQLNGMMALAALYERHHRHVYSLCLRMTNNSAEAEDLAQEVFIHLVRNLGSFRGESKFTSWLYRLYGEPGFSCISGDYGVAEGSYFDDFEKRSSQNRGNRHGAQITDRIALKSALAQSYPMVAERSLFFSMLRVTATLRLPIYSAVQLEPRSRSFIRRGLKLRRLLDAQSPN